ncbi:hypothetical protein F2Q70_00023200 [Brassica cretica]|uniref:IREH1/IRE-like N-terminal domain-containing protein n=1 Tax=Brassica cretica TaxID=69181 RepID=A0A8S9GLD4_BRACR|nr:hypothetical protein F2Q70_00023200 [Brassica cretica]
MVIKNKLFFPSKTSGSSSHDSSNSPISVGSKSPIQSDTKKSETAPKDETLDPNPLPAGGFVDEHYHHLLPSCSERYVCHMLILHFLLLKFSYDCTPQAAPDDLAFGRDLIVCSFQEILVLIRAKFDKAKEEVNSDLAVFAADLVGVLEKNAKSHPEWEESFEDLLILARSCAMITPGDFWLHCEGIVRDLDDRRQEFPPGVLKQLHTRMLFILTRCTRLLQFHKSWEEEEQVEEENGYDCVTRFYI